MENYQAFHSQAVSSHSNNLSFTLPEIIFSPSSLPFFPLPFLFPSPLPPFSLPLSLSLSSLPFQSKSNSELKAMFDQHYQHLVLLSGPLSGIEAVLPKMTLMDSKTESIPWRFKSLHHLVPRLSPSFPLVAAWLHVQKIIWRHNLDLSSLDASWGCGLRLVNSMVSKCMMSLGLTLNWPTELHAVTWAIGSVLCDLWPLIKAWYH